MDGTNSFGVHIVKPIHDPWVLMMKTRCCMNNGGRNNEASYRREICGLPSDLGLQSMEYT